MTKLHCLVLLTIASLVGSSVVTAAEDSPSATEYLKFVIPYFVGTWECETSKLDGQAIERTVWIAKMAANGQYAVTELKSAEGKTVFTSLDGYDPKAKCWRVFAFHGDGSMGIAEVKIDKRTLVAGKHAGATFETRRTQVAADGTETSSLWKTTLKDRDTFEMVQVSGPEADRIRTVCKRK